MSIRTPSLEHALSLIVAGTAGAVGDEFFDSLVRHVAAVFGVPFAFVSEINQQNPSRVRLISRWVNDQLCEPVEFDIRGTACEKVIQEGITYYATGVQSQFPNQPIFKEISVDSYLALPLLDESGQPLGHLGVMDHRNIPEIPYLLDVLRIFAARAAAEVLRRRSERELLRSQEELERRVEQRTSQLQSLLETATDAIITLDESSHIQYVNAAATRVFGYTRAEMEGRPLTMLASDALKQRHADAFSRFVSTGQQTIPWEAQKFMARHKSGREFPVEVSLGVTGGEKGSYVFTGIVRDVTERRRMEHELRERSEQLTQITDALPAFIAYSDLEFRYRFVNAEFERFSGKSRGHLLGKTVREVWGEEMFSRCHRAMESAVVGQHQTFEMQIADGRGTQRALQITVVPRRDEDQEVIGLYMLGSDITDRVQAERALQGQLEFEQLVGDVSARFLNATQQNFDSEIEDALRLLGEFLDVERCAVVQVDATGKPTPTHVWVSSNVSNEQNTFPASAMTQIIASWGDDRPYVQSDWTTLPLESGRAEMQRAGFKSTLTVPLRVAGRLLGGLGVSSFSEEQDFSAETGERLRLIGEIFANALARNHAEEQIRQHHRELTHVARLITMGEMTAGLAHELNQPLTAIAAFADGAMLRLLNHSIDSEELGKMLKQVSDDAQRAGKVIQRLRRFVKKRDADRTAVDVNQLVRDVQNFLTSEITQSQVDLHLSLADGLPPALIDGVEIQQVLLNLMRNAIDAVADQPVTDRWLRIETCMATADEIEVSVADSGSGIANHMRPRLFEPFHTTKVNGLGMGLAISHTIIQSNGGRIWFDDSPARGAIARFRLQPAGSATVQVPSSAAAKQ